ncbi:MAG: hypothetical protein JHC23_06055, partial [Sulfolobus sp.]|nr:hypothetical protein [Sulfolobus sp.]
MAPTRKLSGYLVAAVVAAALSLALAPALVTSAQGGAGQVSVVNLISGFNVPVVLQGNNYTLPTRLWPTYYGPLSAASYWSAGDIISYQPVLELVPAEKNSSGALFWQAYYLGGTISMSVLATYSSGSSPVADGIVFYLFLKPTMWGVEPQYNYSIAYIHYSASANTNKPRGAGGSPVAGYVIVPQSSEPYLLVMWDPYWHYGSNRTGVTGQWTIIIANNPDNSTASFTQGPSPSPNLGSPYAGWDGVVLGYFQPMPGDVLNITVVYNPATGLLSGTAQDESTGQVATFSLNLSGYFRPDGPGYYVFGVGAATGADYANWALLYLSVSGVSTVPPIMTSTTTVTTTTTATVMLLTTTTTTATTTTTVAVISPTTIISTVAS